MRTSAAPFPAAPPDAVRFSAPWQLITAAGPTPLKDDLAAWDYQATVALSAVIEVDSDAVRETCHLSANSQMNVIVTATSSTTKMRGPVAVAAVSGAPIQLNLELRGDELGGRLLLDTLLVATDVERLDALSPATAGSILWRHRQTTWLEGESARFPTEVADFAAPPFFTPGALWYVDIRIDDLETAALGSVRLVLNEKHPVVVRMLAGDASETAATISTLRWDVSRQLVIAALDSDEFVEHGGGFDDETLGAMLSGILTLYWPGESPRMLRQLWRSEPARFERELQDRAQLLHD